MVKRNEVKLINLFIIYKWKKTITFRGIQTNNGTRPVFDAISVKNIKSEEKIYASTQHVKQIFVSVDPAAGGNKSKYAILSCIYVDGHKMVVSQYYIFLFFIL